MDLPQLYLNNSSHHQPHIHLASPNTTDALLVADVNSTERTAATLLASPLAVTAAVLLVFLFSPMILIGNSLVLVATYRFKRLRTPSNYLVMSLATSDLGIGMFMPVGMYLELGGAQNGTGVHVCLLSYGVAITLCCVSVLVMVAIAVDRFTSLARPLRYANLITHTAVERYIAVFWAYSSLVGFTPFGYAVVQGINNRSGDCSFGVLVARPVQLFMFCAVYGPSAVVLIVCYGYIYFIARGHARAISEVRHSLHHTHGTPCSPRYGQALAITAGMFLALWLPFQTCMLIDVFLGTSILSAWVAVYLALPILASSAFNPWVYGYRNAELRCAVRRVVDDLLTALGFTYRSQPNSDPYAPSGVATAGCDQASFINNVMQRECYAWKEADVVGGDFLLVPIAKQESSGLMSETEERVVVGGGIKGLMRGSRSMVESFAVARGSEVMVIKGLECGMTHGASVL